MDAHNQSMPASKFAEKYCKPLALGMAFIRSTENRMPEICQRSVAWQRMKIATQTDTEMRLALLKCIKKTERRLPEFLK